MEISFRHNCFKHDEDLSIRYAKVERVSLDLRANAGRWHRWTDEDQVILDEVLPAPEGCSHEIALHGHGRLTIACRDLVATWTRADCPEWARQKEHWNGQ